MNVACEDEKFFTRAETRNILRFSSSKLDTETRAGRLKVHRFGRLVRISASDLAEYLNSSKVQPERAEIGADHAVTYGHAEVKKCGKSVDKWRITKIPDSNHKRNSEQCR